MDDPREILKAAGVECAEVDAYLTPPSEAVPVPLGNTGKMVTMRVWEREPDPDAAILALARLVAKQQAQIERLQVCGTCLYGNLSHGSFRCRGPLDNYAVKASAACRFTPSRWTERPPCLT